MRSLLTLLLAASFTGCAAFLIDPDGSTATKVTKISARVPMALVTIGISEWFYSCARGPLFSGETPQVRMTLCHQRWDEAQSGPTTTSPAWFPVEPPVYEKDQQQELGSRTKELLKQQEQSNRSREIQHKIQRQQQQRQNPCY